MAEFHEVLSSIQNWEGDERPSPDLYDSLSSEYQSLVDARDGASVVIAEKDTRIQELIADNQRLKADNYDLSVRAGAKEPDEVSIDPPAPQGILGLFERKV